MSGTRLAPVKKFIEDNKAEAAAVTSQQVASYAVGSAALHALQNHASATFDAMQNLAQDYFVPAVAVGGRVAVNGGFRALHAVATGAEWTWKGVAANISADVVAGFGVQGIWNLGAYLSDRTSEVTPCEEAAKIAATAAVSRAFQFVGEKVAGRYSLWQANRAKADSKAEPLLANYYDNSPEADLEAQKAPVEVPASTSAAAAVSPVVLATPAPTVTAPVATQEAASPSRRLSM